MCRGAETRRDDDKLSGGLGTILQMKHHSVAACRGSVRCEEIEEGRSEAAGEHTMRLQRLSSIVAKGSDVLVPRERERSREVKGRRPGRVREDTAARRLARLVHRPAPALHASRLGRRGPTLMRCAVSKDSLYWRELDNSRIRLGRSGISE